VPVRPPGDATTCGELDTLDEDLDLAPTLVSKVEVDGKKTGGEYSDSAEVLDVVGAPENDAGVPENGKNGLESGNGKKRGEAAYIAASADSSELSSEQSDVGGLVVAPKMLDVSRFSDVGVCKAGAETAALRDRSALVSPSCFEPRLDVESRDRFVADAGLSVEVCVAAPKLTNE
jgi:hypothetical protein